MVAVTQKEAENMRCCVFGCGSPDPKFSPAKIQSLRGNVPHFCIGSACMAWRWSEWVDVNQPDSYMSEPPAKGYCGRAGLEFPMGGSK